MKNSIVFSGLPKESDSNVFWADCPNVMFGYQQKAVEGNTVMR